MKLLVFVAAAISGWAQVGAGRISASADAAKSRPAPRLPDGTVDLGNAKGSWNPRVIANIAGAGRQGAPARSPVANHIEAPFQAWAKKIYDENQANLSKDDPEGFCLPPGIPRMYATPFPFQIFQVPGRVLFLFEGGAHIWREVYMDRKDHPKEPNPTYLGDAIGHWEGDALVIDTVGFNERTWLDQDGHPHSEKLHVVERFTRPNFGTLHYEFTIDDPGAYTKTWSNSYDIAWSEGVEPLEYVCQENNKDLGHLVGK